MEYKNTQLPNEEGFFGQYGGAFIPPQLEAVMKEISTEYYKIIQTEAFQTELDDLLTNYVGRPSPLYHAKHLTEKLGGAQIYLKCESSNHTGSHKINHCIGEALLAKHMGKKLVIAETGAGQHGLALATACAMIGMPCHIYMGQVDVEKQMPNVTKIKLLGAKVIGVSDGNATLKDAVDAAFGVYLSNPQEIFYAIGSVVGPHPFPAMVRDFQAIVGREIKQQFQSRFGSAEKVVLPDMVIACVGGGSNAIGAFSAFLNDESVQLVGVEPALAATLNNGKPSTIHGMKCYNLEDDNGELLPISSIASGLVYPGVSPIHSHLKDANRVQYSTATDAETVKAFLTLSRVEGIIPALESSHAVAYAIREAPKMPSEMKIVINLSGRGDKDIDYVTENYDIDQEI